MASLLEIHSFLESDSETMPGENASVGLEVGFSRGLWFIFVCVSNRFDFVFIDSISVISRCAANSQQIHSRVGDIFHIFVGNSLVRGCFFVKIVKITCRNFDLLNNINSFGSCRYNLRNFLYYKFI